MGNRKKIKYIVWKIDYWIARVKPQDLKGVFDWLDIKEIQTEKYYPKFTYN